MVVAEVGVVEVGSDLGLDAFKLDVEFAGVLLVEVTVDEGA